MQRAGLLLGSENWGQESESREQDWPSCSKHQQRAHQSGLTSYSTLHRSVAALMQTREKVRPSTTT